MIYTSIVLKFIIINYREIRFKNIETYSHIVIQNFINIMLLMNHFPSFLR